jgi:hypothetical protein
MEAARHFSESEMRAAHQLATDFWLAATSCYRTMDEAEPNLALKLAKPFPRYDFLRRVAREFDQHKTCIILKPRQMFISWLCVAYALHKCLWNPGTRWLVVSKREADAFKLKARADVILQNLPPQLSALLDQRKEDNKGNIEFEGGSAIHFLPASPSIGRTFTASGVILDEFAFAPWAVEMLTSLQPTLAGGGQLIIPSTPNGVGNEFHTIWANAEERGFHKVKLDWRDHPERDQEWYSEVVKPLSRRMAAQEYDCDFLQSGAVVFDAEDLTLHKQPTKEAIAAWNKEARRHRDDSPYFIGVDTADGLDDGDYSVATVLHKDSGKQVETLSGRLRPDIFAEKLIALAGRYPGLIGIEKASSGGTVILELERAGLRSRLYKHKEWDQKGRGKSRMGWITSSKSKPVMIAELEAAIRQGHLKVTDQATLDELRVYEYKDSASQHSGAPDGYHDDRVIALAIAWQMRKSNTAGVQSVDRVKAQPHRRGRQ